MTDKEILALEGWEEIPGHLGYEIHPEGYVRSQWKHGGNSRRAEIKGSYRLMKPRLNWKGYVGVSLRRGSGRTSAFVGVHRLLAKTFIPNPQNKAFINHRDGNRQNNRLSNLEWVTMQENNQHCCRVLGSKIGEKNTSSKLTWEDVWEIRALVVFGASRKDLAAVYGMSYGGITKVITQESWTHYVPPTTRFNPAQNSACQVKCA